MTRILVLDTPRAVTPAERAALRGLLIELGASECSGPDAEPDAVLTPIATPSDAADAIAACRREAPGAAVVAWARVRDAALEIAALVAGADEVVAGVEPSAWDRALGRATARAAYRMAAQAAAFEAAFDAAQMERLDAMGRLAAGVAHEVNNPLTYVLGSVDLALHRLRGNAAIDGPGVAALTAMLEAAAAGATRVRGIVRDLSTYSHPRLAQPVLVEPAPAIAWALNMAKKQAAGVALIEADIGPLSPVRGDPSALSQALLGVFRHAVAIAAESGRAPVVRVVARDVHENLRVDVTDDGPPLSDARLRRVCEPFGGAPFSAIGMEMYLSRNLRRAMGGGGAVRRLALPHHAGWGAAAEV